MYMFRVKPESKWKVVKADDVWTLKKLPKSKSEKDDEKENPRDEVFVVMKDLLPTTLTVERSHTTHFNAMTIKRLQACYEAAFERHQFGDLKNIGSYPSLRDAATEVLKTEDLLTCINFLFFYVVYLWPYNIRGDRMDANAPMLEVKNFVKSEVKRFHERGMTTYQRPAPKAEEEGDEDGEGEEDEEDDEPKESKKPASSSGKKRVREDDVYDDDDDDDE